MTFTDLEKVMGNSVISSILCEESFTKTRFLTELITKLNLPVIFLDFDLLFSGYTISKSISIENNNVSILRPTIESLDRLIRETIQRIENQKTIIVIDSLNVLSNFFAGKDSGRVLNAYLMLLANISNHSGSKIFFASVAKKKEGMWVLSPTNRHIIDSKKMLKIFVVSNNDCFDIEIFSNYSTKKFSIKKDRW